jgi:8-oxo-dGTP pyrophosphatase MutT (NUDIX family)
MTWKPSVVVSAIIERDGKFLTIEELIRKRPMLTQPGGHLEKDETLVEAVIREVREETAWSFAPSALVGCYRWYNPLNHSTQVRFTFCGEPIEHYPSEPLDEGILGTHWLSRDELLAREEQLRTPLVLRCLDDYLAGRRLPLDFLGEID